MGRRVEADERLQQLDQLLLSRRQVPDDLLLERREAHRVRD